MAKLRVFRLGSVQHRLMPSPEQVEKLEKILKDWDHESDLDIVWGPDIDVLEFDVGPAWKKLEAASGKLVVGEPLRFHPGSAGCVDCSVGPVSLEDEAA